tara:strand:+ start:168 stop:371 length:204 start_codon:yes stop_codon:yes gene_type:complete
MAKRIKFTIRQDGMVTEEVIGAVGNECENLTSEVEKNLGGEVSRIHKPEYYQTQENVTNVTLHQTED